MATLPRSSFFPAALRNVSNNRRSKGVVARSADASTAPALETFDHLEELSEAQNVIIVDGFLPCANTLRDTFDANFENPNKVHENRFCWDYWHIPGRYTQLRTPAPDYFDEKDYSALEAALKEFGKERLGCLHMTPIWLSYYIDGCRQELHCDNVHGPWAFVLSLTEWDSRKFRGGETVLLSDMVLNYWSNYATDTVTEPDELIRLVQPYFNRLTVFDPRIPHGVRCVEGVRDPTEARIVLHGWFTEPEMFVDGAMSHGAASAAVGECWNQVVDHLSDLPEATGTLVIRIGVDKDGSVQDFKFLTDTLVARPWDVRENDVSTARAQIQIAIRDAFSNYQYPSASGPSTITYPMLFE